MDKTKIQTFILSQNEYGQKVYTSQEDRTKSYIINDNHDMIEYDPNTLCAVKLEPAANKINGDEDDGHLMSEEDEEVPTFTMINSLETATEMDNHLMQELDSDLIGIDSTQNNFIQQHLDIMDPLSKLQTLLEQRLGLELSDYEFYLQNRYKLARDSTLAGRCFYIKGMVQVNLELEPNLKRINILDVLKPSEEFLNGVGDEDEEEEAEEEDEEEEEEEAAPAEAAPRGVVQWQADTAYREEQDRLKIPHNPREWTDVHVKHWVQWAVRQFSLPNIKLSDWSINGEQLYEMTHEGFRRIVPNDPGNIFWTHLELLRKMKVVTIKKPTTTLPPIVLEQQQQQRAAAVVKQQQKPNRILPNYVSANTYFDSTGNLSCRGNNGQIQLWQFLLELLTNKEFKTIIHWTGNDGEFKLKNPQVVAQLWGERKNKPTMNYEKLSRALRYYYDGDMISKVHGERFVYKFVCNLRELLGYDARELSNLVNYGNPLVRPEL